MQLVSSSLFALILIAVLFNKGPMRGLPWLFAIAPLGAAAAFNMPAVGGASIGLLDIGAILIFGLVFSGPNGGARIVGSMHLGQPGFYLVLLTFYCIVATIIFPRLFAGQTDVFGISRADNVTEIISVSLRPTSGNITQLFRIMLDVLAFYALATLFRTKPDVSIVFTAMVVATVVNIALGWADVLTFALGVPELLDPIRTANYSMLIDHRMAGMKRMVGGFPEASSFGYFSLGLFAFWFRYWITGNRSPLAFWCLVLTAIVLLRSTSSAAYVAVAVLMAMFAVSAVLRSFDGSVRKRSLVVVITAAFAFWILGTIAFSGYIFWPPMSEFMDSVVFDKIGSQSGVERMSWNTQAFQNFLDTQLMGAGLGSIRASNWLIACLGSIGVIGTGLYLMFLISLARQPIPTDSHHSGAIVSGLKATCLALFISAMLTMPTPDFGVFFFVVAGALTGLSRGKFLEAEESVQSIAPDIVYETTTV